MPESDKTSMAVMRRDVLVATCGPHLGPDEVVRACVEATVLEVNGRLDAATGGGRMLFALTDRRLLTLVWEGEAAPVVDGAVPLDYVDEARVEAAPLGSILTIGLTTGATVRLGVGPAQERDARDLACALVAPPRRDASPEWATEELPRVGADTDLAAELAALCERNRTRILELTPGLVVSPAGDGAATYFVHVAPPSARSDGTCPRCEHVNREGAVFCDACGALL